MEEIRIERGEARGGILEIRKRIKRREEWKWLKDVVKEENSR